MKSLYAIALIVLFASCNYRIVSKKQINLAHDSICILKADNLAKDNSISVLRDSIYFLKQKAITPEKFVQIYKYKRLEKYYTICKRNPTQWKYYKGWSIRVFEL